MKKTVFFIIIFIFLYYPALRAEEIFLTLQESEALGLRDNRDIMLKSEDVKKAKEKIKEAKAGLLPTLTFTGSWTDTEGLYSKDLTQTTTQTSLKQYLYKGGKIINTIKYNGYNFEVAQAILDKTKIETLLNIKKAFFTLLLAEGFNQLNKGILDNTQAHLDFLLRRYESGQASESDVLAVKSSLSSVEEAYEASLNQNEASKALLRNLLYLDENVEVKPNGDFNYEPTEIAYDEAFLKAMKMRPEIRQYEAQEQANKKSIEIAKSDSRPNIYASWDYYSRSHVSATTQKKWNDYNVLGLTVTWPIFDGWATEAKVEQAIVDLKEAQFTKEKTVKDIALELKNAYIDLKNAIAKMQSALDAINLYKDTLKVTEDKYRQGLVSSLDLDDATLSYQVSLFNQRQAVYDYIIAKAKFDKATGG
jgi:outer membrane protein TolC